VVEHDIGNAGNELKSTQIMKKSSQSPSLSLRIDLDSDARIGPGKIQLLEAIQSCGSISAAGRALDMSYKRAWDLVDEINTICGRAAVERQTGGKHGGGAALTPFGISLVERYRRIEKAAEAAARKDLMALKSDIGRSRRAAG
jgi:molybdate transport system regulatory protein